MLDSWISRKVVLILGAGASAPYGFSLGFDLKKKIQDPRTWPSTVFNAVKSLGHEEDTLYTLGDQLRQSPLSSIDAFLERRAEFTEVGKAAIAAILLREERNSTVADSPKGDWYSYLLRLMLTPRLIDFRRNQLSVITFNYERSFEQRVIQSIMTTYGTGRAEAQRAQSDHLKIVHLHGSLGRLHGDESVPYGASLNRHNVERAVNNLKVLHEENTGATPEFMLAHDMIREARSVFVLGFGFHPKNVERLQLATSKGPETTYFFSLHGFTPSEVIAQVKPLLTGTGGHRINEDYDCLEFLRNHAHFLRK
jgi:hypothetical protein